MVAPIKQKARVKNQKSPLPMDFLIKNNMLNTSIPHNFPFFCVDLTFLCFLGDQWGKKNKNARSLIKAFCK